MGLRFLVCVELDRRIRHFHAYYSLLIALACFTGGWVIRSCGKMEIVHPAGYGEGTENSQTGILLC